jgi:hypothetical protein
MRDIGGPGAFSPAPIPRRPSYAVPSKKQREAIAVLEPLIGRVSALIRAGQTPVM